MINLLRFFILQILFTSALFSSSPELEKISLQLKWKHQFQFAGFYIAKEKGFYSDVGLDVEFLEFENDIDIVKDLTTQKVNYALIYPGLAGNSKNRTDIVVLSALLQHSPHVLVSLKSSNIRTIEDFKNRTIMVDSSATHSVALLAMLKSHGIDLEDMSVLKPSFDVMSLVSGETEIITAYTTNELYALDKKNVEYSVWNPTKYGFGFYDDLLVTSKKELKERPDRVESFKQASLQGFEYAYSHIDETVELILNKYNTQNKSKEALLYEALALKKLAYKGTKSVGKITEHRIQRVMDIYNIFGFIKEPASAKNKIYRSENRELLSIEEKDYLDSKNITMCIDPSWMPFEKFKDGKHIGMSADFFKLVEEKIERKIDVISTKTWDESLQLAQTRKCDILSLVMSTPERDKYLKFTEPYLKIPLVMATRLDAPFTANFNSLVGKKLGISKGYAFVEILRNKYPDLNIIEVENLDDGLTKVQEGKLYGYIGTLATIGYAFQTEFTGDLKIAAKFDGKWELGIGVRDDDKVLFDILNKVVRNIDENEKQQILNNWLSIKYESGTNYNLIFELIGIFVVISLIALFFFIKQNKLTRKIQEQKDKLQLSYSLQETLFDTIPNPIFYKDKNGVYQNCNAAFSERVLNLPKEEIIGKTLYDLSEKIPKELADQYKEKDDELFINPGMQTYNTKVKCSNGEYRDYTFYKASFISESNEVLGLIGIMLDITELKETEKELQSLASIDPLSKLYNRRYFSHAAEDILRLEKRENNKLSILMLDIDNFKNINDNYGHKVGDDVIVLLSNLLLTISRESDIVCRFGGEEFILLLPKTDVHGAQIIAQKIREATQRLTLSLDEGPELKFTVSLGASEIILSEVSIEACIKRADVAMYEAKTSGKNRVCIA